MFGDRQLWREEFCCCLVVVNTQTPVCSGLAVELLVEQKEQQVDVDLHLAEHVHDGLALVLQLQEVLQHEEGCYALAGKWGESSTWIDQNSPRSSEVNELASALIYS